MIQLHRLEGFYRVALHHGYAAAARAFPYPISQPAVYQQVRKLEEELGTRLFERAGRDRVEPTAAGRRLLAFCAPFFEQLPAVARAVASRAPGGVLRVEAAALEIRHVLPAWIQRLRAAHPDIEVLLCEVPIAEPARLLRSQVDLIIDHLPQIPQGVRALAIARHYPFLITPAAWPRPRPKSLRTLLRGKPFVSFGAELFQHDLQLAGLRRLGLEAERSLSASTTEALVGFVAAGLGYSLIPWPSLSGPKVPDVCTLRLGTKNDGFAIHAAYRSGREDDPLLVAALQAMPRLAARATTRRSALI
jgi:DNA-binding transcriptional LysR family regulator